MDLQEIGWVWGVGPWTELIWIGTGGGILWTFGFHKMWGVSGLTQELLASQKSLCAVELVKLSW